VAEEGVRALLEHHRSGAAVDVHLADQLVVPCTLAPTPSHFVTVRMSNHLKTNLWLVREFGVADSEARALPDGTVEVEIIPRREPEREER
jgi:RNA 3'-terminal phosphate cyclase (ATP)